MNYVQIRHPSQNITPERRILHQIHPHSQNCSPFRKVQDPKDKVYSLLKKIAEFQIRECKMAERIRTLQSERQKLLNEVNVLRHQEMRKGQSNIGEALDLKLARIEGLVINISRKDAEVNSKTNSWISELLTQVNQQRRQWVDRQNSLHQKIQEIRHMHIQGVQEKQMKIGMLQKKVLEQHEMIRNLQMQRRKREEVLREDPQVLKRINSLYQDFFSLKE